MAKKSRSSLLSYVIVIGLPWSNIINEHGYTVAVNQLQYY